MSWDDYYYNPYGERISQLRTARSKFCGLDTRQTKLLLNKLAVDDPVALAYRTALEIEDNNVNAKAHYGKYKYEYYDNKDAAIKELGKICQKQGWVYGKQKSDVPNIPYVVFFEIPGCEQISFHTKSNVAYMPNYQTPWDGKEDSTLIKIEDAITARYQAELEERKQYLDSTKDKREAAAKKRLEKKLEEQRKKEEAERLKQEEFERQRLQRRLNSYSTEKMLNRYDEFVNDLNSMPDYCVKVKYCDDGIFATIEEPERRFNLFVWEDEKLQLINGPKTVNPKYYDAFIRCHQIINFETKEQVVKQENIDRINAEKEAKRQAVKEARQKEAKEKLQKENELLKPYLDKSPGMSKTLYKSLVTQIKNLNGTAHIAVIVTENGMFSRNTKKYGNIRFNPVVKDKKICLWSDEYKGQYYELPCNLVITVPDGVMIHC